MSVCFQYLVSSAQYPFIVQLLIIIDYCFCGYDLMYDELDNEA